VAKKLAASALLTIGLAALACGASGAAQAAEAFALTSTTFKDGALMPKRTGNANPDNANCVGQNVSPQLSWAGAPEGTKSFAVTMVDPEGRKGLGVYHWVAYGIPPDATALAEGEASKLSDKFVGGKSTQGVGFYSGPCPPAGSPHHYTFVVIATDLDPKALAPGLTLPELWERLAGHAKGAAGLVGLYANPYPQ
jgi:Raf kinase inhibitor-like YbhB/YbcL family protein